MLEQFQRTVYIITTLLLWPDVIGLFVGIAHTLYLLGGSAVKGGGAGENRSPFRIHPIPLPA